MYHFIHCALFRYFSLLISLIMAKHKAKKNTRTVSKCNYLFHFLKNLFISILFLSIIYSVIITNNVIITGNLFLLSISKYVKLNFRLYSIVFSIVIIFYRLMNILKKHSVYWHFFYENQLAQ